MPTSRGLLEAIVRDSDGDVQPGAVYTLTKPDGTALGQSVYADAAGGVPLSSLVADSNGQIRVYVPIPKRVKISPSGGTGVISAFYHDPDDVMTLSDAQTITGVKTGMTLSGTTLQGKTTLPNAGVSTRVLEGLEAAVGLAVWGEGSGADVINPLHTALVIGASNPARSAGRPALLIEHHAKTQTLQTDITPINRPVDTFRVVRKSYDQGGFDAGYATPAEEAVIHSVYASYSTATPFTAAGSGIENFAAHGYIQGGSRQGGFGFYTIQTLASLNGLVFGSELDTTNATGVDGPIHRQRAPGYKSAAAEAGQLYGLNLLADGANRSTAGILIQGGGGNAQYQDGIVYNPQSVAAGGYGIDMSMLPNTVHGLLAPNGGMILRAAKSETNTGVVASATPTTLTVAGTPWTASAFSSTNQWVRITGGLGANQARLVTANTNNTLTVGTWTTTPDATSTFEISPNAFDVLGTGADHSTKFYSPLYFDWKSSSGVGTIVARLRIDSGHFAVGNVDPQARVHILGAGQATATPLTTAAGALGASLFVVDTANAANNGGFLGFGAAAASGSSVQVGIKAAAVNLANYGTADLVFVGRTLANIATDTLSEYLRLSANGNVVVGSAALATTATDGFLHIPTCAGTPTGVPTAYTGRAPLVFDTTGSKLWVRTGGTWKGVVVA